MVKFLRPDICFAIVRLWFDSRVVKMFSLKFLIFNVEYSDKVYF